MSYNEGNFGSVPPFMNHQYASGSVNLGVVKINNGAAYFVALAPLFSLFFEKVAGDRIAAIILWIFTYVLCVLVCRYDKKKILSRSFDTSQLGKYCILPIIYLFMRSKTTRQRANCVFVCAITLFFALINNGFVSYAMSTDETFIVTVKQSAYSDFLITDDIEDYLNPSVDEVFKESLNKPDWNCETVDNETEITVSGKAVIDGKSQNVSITFYIWYDGFKFEGIDITEASLDGVKLDEEQYQKLFSDLYFIYFNGISENKNLVKA